MNEPTSPSTEGIPPQAIYVWLVPSEQVLEQPGSWRIRKWDTAPFPEATHVAPLSAPAAHEPWDGITDRRERKTWEELADELADAKAEILHLKGLTQNESRYVQDSFWKEVPQEKWPQSVHTHHARTKEVYVRTESGRLWVLTLPSLPE